MREVFLSPSPSGIRYTSNLAVPTLADFPEAKVDGRLVSALREMTVPRARASVCGRTSVASSSLCPAISLPQDSVRLQALPRATR